MSFRIGSMPMGTWLGGIIGGSIATVLVVWWAGFLDEYLPPPAQARLALKNHLSKHPQRSDERFRIVLCWLENDNGDDGKTVARAFTSVQGIELKRSARVVAAGGAGDSWIPAMEEKAQRAIRAWDADIAIVGLVKESGESLSLWFVRRSGENTLNRADHISYILEGATLGPDFHKDLNAQLLATALEAVAPFATTRVLDRTLEGMLMDTLKKVKNLLINVQNQTSEPLRLAKLLQSQGTTLQSLGELKKESDWLVQAINSYDEALNVLGDKCHPVSRARIQNRLGGALTVLGGMTEDRDLLIQAVTARNAALTVYTHEDTPIDWAYTQNNLGNTLHVLGKIEENTERLDEAITAHNAALLVFDRERWPLKWANVQNSLGVAKELKGDTSSLEQASDYYRSALSVLTHEKSPLEWALTQNNFGRVLQILGKKENDTSLLDEAVKAYRAALEVQTRDRNPRGWASIQVNLGNTLQFLGEMEGDLLHLEEAVSAYNEALKVFKPEHFANSWAETNHNLDRALQVSAKLRSRRQ